MRITLVDAADLLGLKPEVLRQQLTVGKAKLPPGTRIIHRGQGGKAGRWYLEFWPKTLADLRLAKARGSDAARQQEKPAARGPKAEASGDVDRPSKGQNSEAKGEQQHDDGKRGDGEGRGWWF